MKNGGQTTAIFISAREGRNNSYQKTKINDIIFNIAMLLMLAVISNEEREKLNGLITAVRDGDKQALGEIYKIAGGRMLSVAMGLMRNRTLAEDVLHDSFIKVARFAQQYKENTNAYAWLCTIVRNTALNKIKSENLKRASNIEGFFHISDEGLDISERERVIAVEAAVKSLEPRERTVIWLKYYNDLTVREIATELGIARSTVQDIITAAERKLKRLLE